VVRGRLDWFSSPLRVTIAGDPTKAIAPPPDPVYDSLGDQPPSGKPPAAAEPEPVAPPALQPAAGDKGVEDGKGDADRPGDLIGRYVPELQGAQRQTLSTIVNGFLVTIGLVAGMLLIALVIRRIKRSTSRSPRRGSPRSRGNRPVSYTAVHTSELEMGNGPTSV
jgi:hypothetical protein